MQRKTFSYVILCVTRVLEFELEINLAEHDRLVETYSYIERDCKHFPSNVFRIGHALDTKYN